MLHGLHDWASNLLRSGWPGQVGAAVVGPAGPTCRTAKSGSTIDFFAVSRALADVICKVETSSCFPAAPHSLVAIDFYPRASELYRLEFLAQGHSFGGCCSKQQDEC